MIILSIETSCDETAIAIIKVNDDKFEILSNIVSSQIKIHQRYGGVYPMLAKREHQKNLPIVLKKALREASSLISKSFKQIPNLKFKIPNIDSIAVTVGPGLDPCLWTGINFAKELAEKLKIPIIPVNHIEAHIIANLLPQIGSKSKIKNQKSKIQIKNEKIKFPAVCLVVSGGHTQLILMQKIGKYKIIGETRDDAAGECFDKTARILGLGYPGGPVIAANAAKIQNAKIKNQNENSKCKINLPRPMIYQKNYDFSFSGLKTAVLYDFRNRSQKIRKSKKYIQQMCQEIQQAIIDVLIHKTLKAARDFEVKSIILGGGVVANDELRKQFNLRLTTYDLRLNFFAPAKKFCVDNAAMIGITGYWHKNKKIKSWNRIKSNANLGIE